MAVWLIIALPPKPPEDPKKSKGSLVVVLPAVALLLLLLVKVSAEELVFIFEEEDIIKSDVSCVDEAKSNKVSKLEEDAEETAVVLDGLIRSLKK